MRYSVITNTLEFATQPQDSPEDTAKFAAEFNAPDEQALDAGFDALEPEFQLTEPPAQTETRPMRVLVAEDNATNRLVAGKVLSNWGAQVQFANNGVEAVRAYLDDTQNIDLILMDCEMPDMDGYAATRKIRGSGDSGAAVPIIALTAHALPEYRAKAVAAGMDEYVTKPLQRSQLLHAIESLYPVPKR